MAQTVLRSIPFRRSTAAFNMAADELMLNQAAEIQQPSFRIYSWDVPSLSLGYFQSSTDCEGYNREYQMPWVRRSTGGAAIVHDPDCELTYSLALPESIIAQYPGSMICQIHYVIQNCLRNYGIDSHVVVCGEEIKHGPFLCFLHHTPGDLLVGPAKVAGSAQRKWKGAQQQHGSILFRRTQFASALAGIEGSLDNVKIDVLQFSELFAVELAKTFAWQYDLQPWSDQELTSIHQIQVDKYQNNHWNFKR